MIRIAAFWLVIAAGILWAQDPAAPPPKSDAKSDAKSDLAVLEAAYKADMDDAGADYEKWFAALQKWYLAGLDKFRSGRAKAGDLDGTLAFKDEQERIAAGAETTPEQIQAMPPVLAQLRAAYDSALKKIVDEAGRRKDAARGKHVARLEALQKRLTISGDLDVALLAMTEKDRIASEMALAAGVAVVKPKPSPAPSATPAPSAGRKPLFVNSLGMQFAPVAITGGPTNGKQVLFSLWDTRVQDYAEYARAKGITPEKPRFEQGPAHPAVMVSWEDANAFCEWLTATERASGKIGERDAYRLPSDHEWSCAAGIGSRESAGGIPEVKSEKIAGYPWGTQWPPPKGTGNYGSELKVDEFSFTSPAGSFPANENGLYDMSGNVFQWCEDWMDAKQKGRVLRGGCWKDNLEARLQSAYRHRDRQSDRRDYIGFRCVLVMER